MPFYKFSLPEVQNGGSLFFMLQKDYQTISLNSSVAVLTRDLLLQTVKLEHLVEPARRVPDLEDRLEGSLAESLAQEKALR